MLFYKNLVVIENKETVAVWHYTTLEAVSAILRERKLRLTRVDRFVDPFEGSMTKQDSDDLIPLLGGFEQQLDDDTYPLGPVPQQRFQDPHLRRARRLELYKRCTYACCWRYGEESEGMWRLYCPNGIGIALKTTVAKLEVAVDADDVVVAPIRYRHYHVGSAFTDDLDRFLNKRLGFKHEEELRVLRQDQAQIDAHTDRTELPWRPAEVIDEIVISPYASTEYELIAKEVITARDQMLGARVSRSQLSDPPWG